jgi:hypothetical protein
VSAGKGAYGFRLTFPGLPVEDQDLIEVAGDVPTVPVEWRHASQLVNVERIENGRVEMRNGRQSGFVAVRKPLAVILELHTDLTPAGVVHPLLTMPLSVLARWRGDLTLHAGAFQCGDGAYAVVGHREAGKSTTLALLAAAAQPIVADDLLTIGDGHVWSGPACIDLRPDAATHFADARSIGEVGGRERFRLSARPATDRLPLRGLFVMDWAAEGRVEVTPLSVGELLHLLYESEYIPMMGASDPFRILDVMGTVQAWRVSRPRDWNIAQELVGTMLEVARLTDRSSPASSPATR